MERSNRIRHEFFGYIFNEKKQINSGKKDAWVFEQNAQNPWSIIVCFMHIDMRKEESILELLPLTIVVNIQ